MSSQPAGGANIDLQLSLLHTWTRFRVAEYYQNIFLAHLDELPSHEADNRIKLEIKATLQRVSPFFVLERIHRNRRKLLQSLQDRLSVATTSLAQSELAAVCNELEQLRELNLQAAEQILRMYTSLHCPSVDGADRQMQHYEQMFDSLDTDCLFLRESILNRYIRFDDGYDPFFMSHYEQYHRSENSNSPAVGRLFSLPISYAYRLIKTKNLILELRSQAKPRNYPEESRINDSVTSIKGKPIRGELLISRPHDEWDGGNISNRVSLRESLPLRIHPMQIYPAQPMKSRTTIYPSRQRPETATRTEAALSSQLKFSKIGSDLDTQPRMERNNRVYLPQDEQSAMKSMRRQSLRRQSAERDIIRDVRGRSYDERSERFKTEQIQNSKVTRLTPIRQRRNSKQFQNGIESNIIRKKSEDDELRREKKIQYSTYENIRHYNPIKGQQYQRKQQPLPKLPKYDFNPNLAGSENKMRNMRVDEQPEDPGLLSEQPITKYNIKPKYFQKRSSDDDRMQTQKNNSNQTLSPSNPSHNQNNSNNINNPNSTSTRNPTAPSKKAEKVDQEAQTIELKNNDAKQAKANNSQPNSTTPKPSNQTNPSLQEKQANQPAATPKNAPQKQTAPNKPNQPDSGQTLQKPKGTTKNKPNQNDDTLVDEDIIDQRPPKQSQPEEKKPLIRTVDKKDPAGKGDTVPDKKEPATANPKKAAQNANTGDKRQIRMKNGKSTVEEFLKLLGKGNLQPPLAGPQLEKLQMWVKQSQTYLTQFHVGDQLAVIALSSPIPGIGMALKLWARVDKLVDDTVSSSLFKKYTEFVEKSTSVPKQVYSGAEFPELLGAGFVMKKEKLYERVRKLPAAESPSQFKPFIYIECSNVRFAQTSKQSMLYSEEIEEFSAENSFVLKSIGEVSAQQPDPLKPIVKVTEKIKDFKAVNDLLTKEEFDNYEASQVSANGISVLRLTFTCPLRSTFLAQDGWLRVTGQLIYQKQKECIVSIGASLHNSTLYFGKGMPLAAFLQKIKTAPTAKAVFSVKMFSKKMYGKMIGLAGGCYGNWEVNLTWEDEMKGRIIHPITQGRCFGNQPFLVGIQVQKILVYCLQVGQDDYIF